MEAWLMPEGPRYGKTAAVFRSGEPETGGRSTSRSPSSCTSVDACAEVARQVFGDDFDLGVIELRAVTAHGHDQ